MRTLSISMHVSIICVAFLQQIDSNCVEICFVSHYCPVCTYALHICGTSVTRLLRAYTCLCALSLDSFSLVHVHFRLFQLVCISQHSFAPAAAHFFVHTCCYLLQNVCTYPPHFRFFLSAAICLSLPALVVCTCHHTSLLVCTRQKLSARSRIADSPVDGAVL
ncbi:uncharacterized protein F5147DRAFT_714016 [Suillus discolor]|uniref:Secreted protein n=1 Tax=Suillus discolor TaxID=1912936 RepID=A0A9P7F008_9AGAM|nr:uncharacterized protein F5147DRAFT_714016 [Suillus discolor]KAG2098448.1 hypothetical protein F5147DRAFT_714016 [Suillus discolor]